MPFEPLGASDLFCFDLPMNTQYRFSLCVECPDGKRHIQAFNVDAFAAPQLQPYDLCSEPITAMMVVGVMSMGAARIDTDRKRLAEQVSAALTNGILNAIKGRDLQNGYEQNK